MKSTSLHAVLLALAFTVGARGVPALAANHTRVGFGRQLVELGLPYQLDARTAFKLERGGLRCELDIPLAIGEVRP